MDILLEYIIITILLIGLSIYIICTNNKIEKQETNKYSDEYYINTIQQIFKSINFAATAILSTNYSIIFANKEAHDIGFNTSKIPDNLYQLLGQSSNKSITVNTLHVKQKNEPLKNKMTYHLIVASYANYIIVIGYNRNYTDEIETKRTHFISNISHELKNPIGAILLLTEASIVAYNKNDIKSIPSLLQHTLNEINKLKELINTSMHLYELSEKDDHETYTLVSSNHIINTSINNLIHKIKSKNITINIVNNADVTIYCNITQLITAITNLLGNAIDYSNNNSKIIISTDITMKDNQEYINISITDQGIGIPESDINYIFNRFYRSEYGQAYKKDGHGLGLAIVKNIINKHNGTIDVWSKIKIGSTFRIVLPVSNKNTK